MGYRSDLAIEFDDHHAKILKILCSQDGELKQFIEYGIMDNDFRTLRFESVKWYEGYPEIDKMEKFLNEIEEESFHFIRLGEDFQDTETKGYLDSGMYINRSIEKW